MAQIEALLAERDEELAAAGLATYALRNTSAALRHAVWSMALAALLLLPVLEAVLPSWEVEPLYVALSNATGAPAIVPYTNPAAATVSTWTEWPIPLQAFADKGINLANIDKIAIGLGSTGGFKIQIQDRTNAGLESLQGALQRTITQRNQQPGLAGLFSSFSSNQPQLYV